MGRIEIAARTLRVSPSPESLVRALCRFSGWAVPDRGPCFNLLQALVQRLDAVEAGLLRTRSDLHAAAKLAHPWDLMPSPTQAVLDVIGAIDVYTSYLPPATLRGTAAHLAVPRGLADVAITQVQADRAEAALEPRWDDPSQVLSIRGKADGEEERAFTNRVLTALADPALSDPAAQLVVRRALRLRMTQLGDVLLRLSEWTPAELPWLIAPQGCHHEPGDGPGRPVALAWCPVRGAPQPLHARIIQRALREDRHAAHVPFFAAETGSADIVTRGNCQRQTWYRWAVGWQVDGEFKPYELSGEPTLAAAQFGAGTAVAAMLASLDHLRMPLSSRLLIPRRAAVLDKHTRVVDLGEILDAVMNAHVGEQDSHPAGPPQWQMQPHVTAAREHGSIVAVLMEHLSIPLPDRDDPANHVLPDDNAFTAYLDSQAIRLTLLASMYLSGLSDAGPGTRTLQERHTAAMRAVLAGRASAEVDLLGCEIPPGPAGAGYHHLVDIRWLERWLRPPADDGFSLPGW